jgi:hypothetical protein
LHPDPAALAALPFSFLVVNVPFEFFHRNLAAVASHVNPFVSRIARAIRTQNGGFMQNGARPFLPTTSKKPTVTSMEEVRRGLVKYWQHVPPKM